MGCSCNNKKPAGGLAATREANAREAEAAKARAANPSTQRIGGPRTASGVSQTFSLSRGGALVTFGSRLERDADLARRGGTAV